MKGIGWCLALIVLSGPVAAETLYKWVDQRGVTHYDEKPPRGIGGTRVDISPNSPSDADYRAAEARRVKMVKAARELERRELERRERAERERKAREAAKRDKEERLARERREREAARLAACERSGGKRCGAPAKTHRKRTVNAASD